MSKDIPGLVETSLNLGIMRTDEKGLALSYALRSSVEAEKKHLTGKIKILTEYMEALRKQAAYILPGSIAGTPG